MVSTRKGWWCHCQAWETLTHTYAFTGLGIDRNRELPEKEQALLCVGSTAESQASSAVTAPDSLILLVIDTAVSAHAGGVCLRLWTVYSIQWQVRPLSSRAWLHKQPCGWPRSVTTTPDPVLLPSALTGLVCLVCLTSSEIEFFPSPWDVTFFF